MFFLQAERKKKEAHYCEKEKKWLKNVGGKAVRLPAPWFILLIFRVL